MKSLKKISTNPPSDIDKRFAEEETLRLKMDLYDLQNKLYATKQYSLLIILQGMDAAGKDGTIRNVFSCVNPMGCLVKSFKVPTEEEKAHDFLWRIYPHSPASGMIQIFNRSHYEDILIPTVYKTLDKKTIESRYDLINRFENTLVSNNTKILKFYLHVSKAEQKERLDERLVNPAKKWKYSPADFIDVKKRDQYLEVYENIFSKCSPEIPWAIVPADHKWYRNYFILKEIVEAMKSLKMTYPD